MLRRLALPVGIPLGIIVLLIVADIATIPIRRQKIMATMPELNTQATKLWLAHNLRTDEINKAANAIIQAKELEPGTPLPPHIVKKVILRKNPGEEEAWGLLDEEQGFTLKTNHHITNGKLETYVDIFTRIQGVVPRPGEPYAVSKILGNAEVVDGGQKTHPEGEAALKIINQAQRLYKEPVAPPDLPPSTGGIDTPEDSPDPVLVD